MGSRGSARGRTTGQPANPVDDLCGACVPRTQSRTGVPGGLLIGEEGRRGEGKEEERGRIEGLSRVFTYIYGADCLTHWLL